ncbi:sugar transferase [Candidatus Saccharibacteria bacterium]|nr:sugar transferase [Candidatus Saccharibacteria bacterium]
MKKWEDIPASMKNNSVKKYYKILQRKKVSRFLKRTFDIIFSVVGMVLLSPVFLILAIAIKIDSKGPVFFRQERVTRYGKTFKIFKFRTMVENADKKGTLVTIKNDKRITRIGKLIRKCRLDEIPQLINIFVGEMSFVGTRPEVRKYVDAYTDEMKATLLMRAGVTSEASMEFKDEDEMLNECVKKYKSIDQAYVEEILPKKMFLNIKYIEKLNLLTDVGIMLKTAISMFRR